jgi:hypothetical protein
MAALKKANERRAKNGDRMALRPPLAAYGAVAKA